MAPKAAPKTKDVKPEPSTPKPKVKPEATETPKKTPASSAKRPKPAAPPPRKYKVLSGHVADDTYPVDVKFEGSQQAVSLKDGGYSMELKLEAANSFNIVTTVLVTEGVHQGMQALIIRPAKPFKFMKLPDVVRNRVYRMYFAPKGLTDDATPIVLDGKRTSDKTPWSKSYAEGSKNRVALLAVSKEVNTEASDILYQHPLRFESTTVLGEFLVEYRETRPKITNVEVKTYKKGSRIAFSLLAECIKLGRLRLEAGVASDEPKKAAKTFYLEAGQLLAAIGRVKKDKNAGVDMISFAKGSLMTKGDKPKVYNEEMVGDFLEELKKLCK